MTNEVKNVPALRFPEFDGDWEEKKLKDISNKGMYGIGASATEFDGENVYVRITDINESSRKINNDKLTSPDRLDKKYLLNENDVLFARTGASTGKTYIHKHYDSDKNYYFAGFLIKFEFKNNYLANFIFQNTLTKRFENWVSVMSVRSGQPGINSEEYGKLKMRFPSKVEQNKIGDFFSKLDRQIELEEQKLEKLEEQKKGYMQKIFSQELRFKDENGNKYPEWEEKEINSVLEKIIDNRGKTPENNATEIYPMLEVNSLGNYYPKYNNVAKFVSEKTYKTWFREHIKLNDVLFSTVGNTGLVSLMDNNKAVIAQNIVGLRINSENDATFLYYLLSYWENQKKVKQIQMGAVQPSVKVSQFKYLKFYFPTKDEQQEIGVFLTIFDKIFEKQSKKIEILKERKQGLLQKMFV